MTVQLFRLLGGNETHMTYHGRIKDTRTLEVSLGLLWFCLSCFMQFSVYGWPLSLVYVI